MPADPAQRYRFVCWDCGTRFDYSQGESPLASDGSCKACGGIHSVSWRKSGWTIYKLNKDGSLGEQV